MGLILANDGIDATGKQILEAAGFTVQTDKVAQSDLAAYILDNSVAGVLVRSATQITTKELTASKSLKVIGRAGVGLDNIDLKAAEANGVAVVNTCLRFPDFCSNPTEKCQYQASLNLESSRKTILKE
jgi:D-3-phosphoglycerate dehydrogenase / 2-oxoglutarate reductase